MPGNLSLLFLLLPLLTACESIPYYSQAVRGHFALMMERRPIQQLLGDDDLDGTLKRQLLLAQSMRDFASESLKLPDNGSYRSFVPAAGE
ncbi:MAG: aminopeptidase, partial [Gammaproteobacteria bacterium]|nr:aminopeptidase [Gammaproteobacteria bacterium]